ncbi:hypothetical protein PanWU01x14_174570 [Parasponia andersonii]|uniref:Uncharacterized protein n=1 Tax=Parasponia andersonii TaxID=3476 RepID=A0A2P5C8D8_PARAD|nr:hypothetical protein PanWU01x14_174570 [Parasponia andersonii]
MDKQRLEINLDDLESNSVDVPIDVDDENDGSDKFEDDLDDVTQDVFKMSINEEEPSSTTCSNSVGV